MTLKRLIADYRLTVKKSLFSVQILLVAFGALVTVPIITGLDPNVALFSAGAGTLIFHFFTKREIPVFLASSFAFTAPIISAVKTWGIPATLGGLAVSGLVYMALSRVIKWKGTKLVDSLFPPIVTGPVIIVIGLMLAPVAVSMALGKADPEHLIPEKSALLISIISLATTVLVFLLAKGALKLIPIICGLCAGYLVSIPFGIIDFSIVTKAPWFAVPNFVFPKWNWDATLFLIPATIVPVVAHFGDILAIGEVAGKNYLKYPGIHCTLLGNGAATTFAACVGGPPNRIYAEITGTVALFKLFEPALMVWAAIFTITLAFVAKLGAVIQTVPSPVTGGMLILFFGTIMVIGANSLTKNKSELLELRNLLIVALTLVFGIGGITFSAGTFTLKGVALATIVGVILNLVLPDTKINKDA
jgi:uracil permease